MNCKPNSIDAAYTELVKDVLKNGKMVKRRNSECKTLAGRTITYELENGDFPIITQRKLYLKGIIGEFAALMRGPKNIFDFKKWGCNYWDQFADDKTGKLTVDYGNAWLKPVNQVADVYNALRNLSNSRRLIINGWVPQNISKLSLPCCHFAYQLVNINNVLHLVWYQRSADVMVGIPSDMVLANLLLIGMASANTMLSLGSITMHLGDTHIYKEHIPSAYRFIEDSEQHLKEPRPTPQYELKDFDFLNFTPDMINIYDYKPATHVYEFKCIK